MTEDCNYNESLQKWWGAICDSCCTLDRAEFGMYVVAEFFEMRDIHLACENEDFREVGNFLHKNRRKILQKIEEKVKEMGRDPLCFKTAPDFF